MIENPTKKEPEWKKPKPVFPKEVHDEMDLVPYLSISISLLRWSILINANNACQRISIWIIISKPSLNLSVCRIVPLRNPKRYVPRTTSYMETPCLEFSAKQQLRTEHSSQKNLFIVVVTWNIQQYGNMESKIPEITTATRSFQNGN